MFSRRPDKAKGLTLDASKVVPGTPLRQVIALCLEAWDVTSDDESEDSSDFCGWRVGSRCAGARPNEVEGDGYASVTTSSSDDDDRGRGRRGSRARGRLRSAVPNGAAGWGPRVNCPMQ